MTESFHKAQNDLNIESKKVTRVNNHRNSWVVSHALSVPGLIKDGLLTRRGYSIEVNT